MRLQIPARELTRGDVLRIHDWRLHVLAVEHELGTAVLTSEFDFLLHFCRHDAVDVEREPDQPSAAA
ncbi:MAG TPA: hypothetical protein VKB75_10040 [Jatrophihabitans sp.]|nr:hypothetical protein [Jatrophihabitans sp.]